MHKVPSRPIDMAIEQLPRHKSTSPLPLHETTPHTSPAHYATPASARSAVRKLRYTEIDISMYDNPKLMSYKGIEEEEVGGVKEEGEESKRGRRKHRDRRVRNKSPHEEILVFVGNEWKDLAKEVRIIAS